MNEGWYRLIAVLNLEFSTDLQEFKLYTDYSAIFEQIEPLQPVCQAAEFKFEFKFEPLQVIRQYLPKAIPEGNKGFD